jgi:DNA-binding response OmpR family regulator
VAGDGEAALTLARTHPLDVVVLDILLPGCSGLEVLVQLKALQPEAEVVMFTVLDEAEPAKEALRDGAFDYLVKSPSIRQILAVINKAWAARQARTQVCLADLHVDLRAGVAMVAGEPVELTSREWAVLSFLAQRCGEIVEYADLWRAVWSTCTPPARNLIQRTVSNLRAKVGEACIQNVRGQGYRLG